MAKKHSIKISVPLQEVQRLFVMGTELADLAEDILESHGLYQPEFLKGLQKSVTEARSGRVQKITSLADLR